MVRAYFAFVPISWWCDAAPCEHEKMPEGMAIGGMSERAHDGPVLTPLGEFRQMLADADSGRACRDGAELAANFGRCVRLQIETVMLRKPARQEDIDARPRPSPGAGAARG